MNKVLFYLEQQQVYTKVNRDHVRALIQKIESLIGSNLRLEVRRAKLAGTKFSYEFEISDLEKAEKLASLLSEKRNIGFKIVGKVIVNSEVVMAFTGGCLK